MFNPDQIVVLQQSALVGALATAIVALPAIALAYLLAFKQFAGKTLLGALILSPLIIPLNTTWIGNYNLLSSFYGGTPHLQEELFWPVTLMTSVIMAFPLMLIPVTYAFTRIDTTVLKTAYSLGATPSHAFVTVLVPMTKPALAGGVILAFAKAFTSVWVTYSQTPHFIIPGITLIALFATILLTKK